MTARSTINLRRVHSGGGWYDGATRTNFGWHFPIVTAYKDHALGLRLVRRVS
jgi:hypothetical protein